MTQKRVINVGGRDYPCRLTMGAPLRFKRELGKDVKDMDNESVEDQLCYFWACVASACAADGVEFGLSLQEFADKLTPEDMTAFYLSVAEEQKKTT